MALTFGSLFAGIGGLDLGLERAGMVCKWQVEIDPWCRRVLAKHWPDVRRHDDIKTFPLEGDWSVDVICGGFPCQDISNAGKRAGINGERSGLWSEMLRVIRVVRPRIVVVENVAALLGRGMDRVLGDLSESGFDAAWSVLAASDFGAPHIRERVFLVGHAYGPRRGSRPTQREIGAETGKPVLAARGEALPDAGRELLEVGGAWNGDGRRGTTLESCGGAGGWWATEPDVGRVAHGIPARVDRLRGLGNAVVPQVAEWIGRRIVEANQG